MIIPSKIVGRKKIRNAQICHLWLNECLTGSEIAKRFHISETRVSRILQQNSQLLKYEADAEKRKRIHWLKRQIKNRQDKTKKDTADLLEQLRKEIEGDKPLVDNSEHTIFQIINYGEKIAVDTDRIVHAA